MWSLAACETHQRSQKFRSSAKKDFFNNIGQKQTSISECSMSAPLNSGHEAKATAHQVRVRATTPATICIITPTTHPSIIVIVQTMRGSSRSTITPTDKKAV